MILSQAKVNNLLRIFENPKNVEPYNISYQKKEVENASKFINDYHIYGSPKTYQETYPIINQTQKIENISRTQSIRSQNTNQPTTQSVILSNDIQNLQNNDDIEIHHSITNLKNGQKEYNQKTASRIREQKNSYYPRYSQYPKYNPATQSISAYEYQKNESILNSILNNSINHTNTQYLSNEYGESDYNKYNTYTNNTNNNNYDYLSTNNINSTRIRSMNYIKPTSLKDIPSNPDDVVITEIPQNLAISMNPLSSSNLRYTGSVVPIQPIQTNIAPTSQEILEKPKMIEEINTDIIPNEPSNELNPTQTNEEPVVLETLEPQNEPEKEQVNETEPEVQKGGKYKITEFGGPVKLPAGYSTDDEDEFNAIQILNQDLTGWKLQIDKDNIKVYSKLYKIINDEGKEVDNIMFFTDATIDHPASEVIKQLNTYSLREKWEKSLQKGKLIKEEDLPGNVHVKEYYAYIKMPFIFSDRDLILRKKSWNNYNGEKDCCLNHLKSIEHPDFPAKKKPVRAIYENRGEYIKPINDNQCKLYLITKFDMKLSAPISMMEGKGSEGQAKWVKEFIKHCGN